MITNMVISNAPIDGSILIRDEGYCRIKQGDKTIRRTFGTPKGLEAEVWVESYVELPSYQTMVETFAYYYANTTRLCWFEHVKP